MSRGGLGIAFLVALLSTFSPAQALKIELPGDAQLTWEEDREADTYFLPTGPVADGIVPVQELEGRIIRQAWRIEGEGLSTLALVTSIREQLQARGYELLLDCTTEECGGFDFLFGTDVLPGPDMFVDLFDFRFLAARNARSKRAEYMTAMVSKAAQTGYVQLVFVGAGSASVVVGAVAATSMVEVSDGLVSGDLMDALVGQGHTILPDLVFAPGSARLAEGSYASLALLAAFLKADADRRVVLVGHTDAVGSLEDNVKLSRERAASVMDRLVAGHGVTEGQLSSNGMGYLSPVASNATSEGRNANRRVEAVLLSGD